MSDRPPSALLVNFGCKINQYEGDALRNGLARLGFVLTDHARSATVAIVNTCTVTARADAKARHLIHRLHREAPALAIYVTGCAAVRDAETFRGIEGVRDVLPDKGKLLALLSRDWHLSSPSAESTPCATGGSATGADGRRGSARVDKPPVAQSPSPTRPFHRTRATLKVQDGCDAFCAYCIVPHVRPTLWSKPPDGVLDEARGLIHAGFREIVLTGIHLGRYGVDRDDGFTLSRLVARVADLPGMERLRLSSIEMPEVDDALVHLIAGRRAVCPHLHLPLQSGDDDVLRAMNRRYASGDFLAAVARLRERVPDISITTDVIAGFPGETDDAFANTLRVCREAGFSRMHVFPFSARPGTAAARLPGRLPSRAITARKKRLLALADELALAYKRRFLGTTVEVLVESTEEREGPGGEGTKQHFGLTPHYLRVRFPAEGDLSNRIVPVRVVEATSDLLLGERDDRR